MADYVEQGEVKQLLVQRRDGSTWRAEIGMDGRVRLVEKLNSPSDTELVEDEQDDTQDQPQDPPSEQDGQGGQDQQQDQADQGETDDEWEPGEGDLDAWGEAAPTEQEYKESDIDKLINEMGHRGSTGSTADGKEIPKRYKLNDAYHKRLKDPAFMARLRSVMLDNKYARRVRGRTRGKLDMGRLYKVPTMSRNVFLQKQERKGKMYNVVLVIDQSGSMSGRPAELAAETVLFLTKQFEHMNINIGIIGYGDSVGVIKELNTKKVNYDELYMGLMRSRGGTNDYPALRRAYHMFTTAPEGKNILIHLSDGGPGGYRDSAMYDTGGKLEHIKQLPPLAPNGYGKGYVNYNDKEHLHHLVKSHRDVEAYGIGIQQGGWQIPEYTVIHKLEDMKPAFLKFLRGHITRG